MRHAMYMLVLRMSNWQQILEQPRGETVEAKKPVDQLEGLRALATESAVRQAVEALPMKWKDKDFLDRQYKALVGSCTEAENLILVLQRLLRKDRESQAQKSLESDLEEWMRAVRQIWGSEDKASSGKLVLERLDAVLEAYSRTSDDVDWAVLAQMGVMELANRDDDEFSLLMDTLLGVKDKGFPRGSAQQEGELRNALAMVVKKSSSSVRQVEVAEAFESVVKNRETEQKSAADFLARRVSQKREREDTWAGQTYRGHSLSKTSIANLRKDEAVKHRRKK